MNLKVQLTALYTHIHHEYSRMARIPAQIIMPSMITTFIYFLIFGAVIGKRVGTVEGVDYSTFITPGLVMLSVITNSYMNSSSSLFSMRFQHSVEELLISPMRHSVFLLGYVIGGIIRGLIVAIVVLGVAMFFVDIKLSNLPLTILIITLFSCLFSLAGFTNGMLAKTFDELSVVPTFVLSPLTYLGGVFFSVEMLSPFWHKIAIYNPIYYMVDILRFVMINHKSVNMEIAFSFIGSLVIFMAALNMLLLKRGIGIRN